MGISLPTLRDSEEKQGGGNVRVLSTQSSTLHGKREEFALLISYIVRVVGFAAG